MKLSKQILFRATERDLMQLKKNCKKSGLSQAEYIRMLLRGYVPREQPPVDYFTLLYELQTIGRNFNQIAIKANSTGYVDMKAFTEASKLLNESLLDIKQAVLCPDKVI